MLKSFVEDKSEILYYNGLVTNNQSISLPAKISDIRGDPLIQNPSDDWHMSVVRFNIEKAHTVPLTVVNMQPGAIPGVLSDSVLSFTMTYLGTDYQEFVQLNSFRPEYNGAFINFYQELLTKINTCLANIFASLAGPPPSVTTPPMFVYDSESQLITLYFEENYALIGDVQLFMNVEANDLLLGYEYLNFDINDPNGKVMQFDFNSGYAKQAPALALGNRDGFPLITNSIPDNMRYMPQDSILISSWNKVRNIFLTSNTLPIYSELTPAFNGDISNNNVSNSYTNIISDFLLNLDNNGQRNRLALEYLPTAEYRMIKMRSKEPLRKINIEAYMTLNNGATVPILLEPNSSFSVKLLFRRNY